MKLWMLPAAVVVLGSLAAGCGGPAPSAGGPPGQAAAPARPSATSQQALGKMKAQGTISGKETTIEADFGADGKVAWMESAGGKKTEFDGRWRREDTQILVLLSPKGEGGSQHDAVLEREGKGWRVASLGGKAIDKAASIVLTPE